MSKKPKNCEGQMQLDYNSAEAEILHSPEPLPGVFVNLSEGAPYLLEAEKEYSKFSRNRGLVDGYYSGKPWVRSEFNETSIERIGDKADVYRSLGATSVRQAYRLKREELIRAGFDPIEIDDGEAYAVRSFERYVVGPDNKKRREKLKKAWEKQSK